MLLRPRVPGFIVPLTYSEMYGGEASRVALEEQLRRVDWRGVAEVAAGIAAASTWDGIEDPKHQIPLVANFATNPLIAYSLNRRVALEPNRPVFYRESLLAVLRVALTMENEIEASQGDFNDAFLRAVLDRERAPRE